MITEAQLFDFETVVSDALKTVFTAENLVTRTVSSLPKFQLDRLRIEAFTAMGGSKGKLYVADNFGSVPGTTYETLRKGQCSLTLITQFDNVIHGALRARVRNMAATMNNRLNAVLQYHFISWFSDAGASYSEKPNENIKSTKLNFDFEINIIDQAITDFLAQG